MQLHPKVTSAALAGAVTTLIVYALSFWGIAIPANDASAITTVLSFAAGYLTPSKAA